MKKTVEMCVYVCDSCGRLLDDGEAHCGYVDADIWDMTEHLWVEHDGGHYCPDCYDTDEEDNVIIKQNKK